MPCDSIVLNKVELALADKTLLKAALEALGAKNISADVSRFSLGGFSYEISNGKLIGQGQVGKLADQIKRQYGKQTVHQAARRFGWTVEEQANGHLQVKKRF